MLYNVIIRTQIRAKCIGYENQQILWWFKLTTPNSLFLNEDRLKQYFITFQELHQLHAKQNENLRKLVENHEKRITALTEKIEDLT